MRDSRPARAVRPRGPLSDVAGVTAQTRPESGRTRFRVPKRERGVAGARRLDVVPSESQSVMADDDRLRAKSGSRPVRGSGCGSAVGVTTDAVLTSGIDPRLVS